jgi:hypothetical protein
MLARFDRALEPRHCRKRQGHQETLRLERNEGVEQWLHHVAPIILMPRRTYTDIVEGDALGASLL